jgi:general secretion pathway protein A
LQSPSPFVSAAIDEVHRCSHGVPRLINLLCDRCLMTGFQKQQKVIPAEMVDEARASLGLPRPTDAGPLIAPPISARVAGASFLD